MHEKEEGHVYVLSNYSEGISPLYNTTAQQLSFMKKVNGTIVGEGTTNEEVLKMMVHRMNYLQSKFPCRENAIVITKLEECLMWLNYRTEKRVAQGVEGKDIAHKS